MEEGIEILHAFDNEDGGTEDDTGPDLGETTDVVEGAIDDKDKVVGEALTSNEVLCIGNDGTMADHHTFRLARGACGVKDIGDAVRNI